MEEKKWDVFISHASEDKDSIARPLARELQKHGLRVWFDEDTLNIGDSLLESINYGLVHSDYCIVIISPKFLSKKWTQLELSGNYQLANPNGKILPVWHQVSQADIASVYPILANLVAVSSKLDLKEIAEKIVRVIKPTVILPVINPPDDTAPKIDDLENLLRDLRRDNADFMKITTLLEKIETENSGWYHSRFRQEFLRLLHNQTVPIKIRARAGNSLALIGDSRFRADAWFLPDEDLLGFVAIPSGRFIMGSGVTASATLPSLTDGPQHYLDLPPYYIGRYPVTNAQYRVFLKETSGSQPKENDRSKDNHPVVSLNWHEALSYCAWLYKRICGLPDTQPLAELLRSGAWSISLPSEAEWEKSARGMYDARKYPWGMEANPNNANYQDTGLKTTSAVGCFADGASPFGAFDLSGNVSEWTRSIWGEDMGRSEFEYPYQIGDGRENIHAPDKILRVIRGGSFYHDEEKISCTSRDAEKPNAEQDHIGFRLVITKL